MNGTLASYIDLLTPWIPTDAVSEPYLHHIRTISRSLPALSFGCFEYWLADGEPRVDFNVGITSKRNEHQTIAQWFTSLPESDSEQQITFRKLQTICSAWSNNAFPLRSQIKILWLVYDIPDPLSAVSVPWLYVHFRENQFMNDALVRPEIILKTLKLIDYQPSFAKQNTFRLFFESIPPTVQICAVGAPTNRGDNPLRVYLVMQTFADLQHVLTNQAWPGDTNELREQMSPFMPHCDFFALLIDINPGVQPRIGIECWFNEPSVQNKLIRFTDRLLESGLCSAQKREPLLHWNGSFEPQPSPLLESWPDHMPPANQRVVTRKMAQYVKLVYEPGKPFVAKGYLYFDRLLKGNL